MILFYSLGIKLYVALLHLVSPFNQKAKLMLSGRKNWEQTLKKKIDPKAKYLWFHCSSLGEFEQGRPLIEAAKNKYSSHKILLTFFSPSGYEIRKNYEGADMVCYLPFDSRRNAEHFIALVKPQMAFFVKYEYWHYFIKTLSLKEIPCYLVSAIFREKQIFFRTYGSWFRKILSRFTMIFVQDAESQDRLHRYNIKNTTIAGDTRFDRVADVLKHKKDIPLAAEFSQKSLVLVAGSTWPGDEEHLISYINKSSGNIKFIIAPHEIHASRIESIQSQLKVPYLLYTQSSDDSKQIGEAKVLIADTIGVLSSLYQYGNVAYIGGGFGVGIHNTLEAATYSIPVIFGPNYKKFREAVQLIKCGGAFSITSGEDFSERLDQLLNDVNYCKSSGQMAGQYVAENTGASELILNYLK